MSDADETASAKAREQIEGLDAFLKEYGGGDNDAKDDNEPVRLDRVNRRDAKQRKKAAAAPETPDKSKTPRGARRSTGAPKTPASSRKRKAGDMNDRPAMTPEQSAATQKWTSENREKIEERARRKEMEIMHGGRYFKIRDEAAERDKAVRDARRNKMEGRENVDRAVKLEEVSVLEQRQVRIRDMSRHFYSSTESHAPHVALGEIVTLVPQHNIGYIEVLGDDTVLPPVLQNDTNFLKGKFARKILFDGTTLLHQSVIVGDIVKVEFERLYQGTDVVTEERKWKPNDVTAHWIATKMTMWQDSDERVPFKSQMVPQEVRKYMLSLLFLIEAGSDLPMYVKVVQELELWRRILGEEYTNKPTGGLMQWHVLLILSIASRPWLEESNMPILLWSFYNSFTGSRFLNEILPLVLRTESLGCSVLLNVAQFTYLYKQHTAERVDRLHAMLQEKKQKIRDEEPSLLQAFEAALVKLDEAMKETKSFPTLLHESAKKGYNALRIRSKAQLENVDSIIAAESAGHSAETDGIDPLMTLDEIADEDALDPKNLPKNRVSGPYVDPEEYTRHAFQLLRADAYKEFQFSMHHKVYNYQQFAASEDAEYKREVGLPTTWTKLVGILGVNYTGSALAGRLCYTVRFREFEAMQEAWKWRMFAQGNLVGLTTDRFRTNVWWAVVSHRDQALLSQGIVGLEFISGNPLDLQMQLQQLQRRGDDRECWLIEARSIFFAGFRPVFEALQQFTRKAIATGHCPFEDYLVYARDRPKMPLWVEHNQDVFSQELQNCVEENTFDPSQERAIRGLANNFLLVQGPPGTGKSYTGVKMVEVILRTRFAVMDKINKNKERLAIAEKLNQARSAQQLYQKLQDEVEALKNKILQLKYKRERASGHEKAKYRMEIDTKLKVREAKKIEMHNIDAMQSRLFAEIMELEQKKELAMREWRQDSGPIQIITYKNHSLDEFLMDVKPSLRDSIEDPTRKDGLVRFGSRSQCEELMQYNVVEHVRRFEAEPNIMSYYKLLSAALRNKVSALKNLGAEISHLQGGNLTTECMECNMTEKQARNFGEVTEAKIQHWRGTPYVEVLVSLEDAAKNALQEDLAKKALEGDDDDSDDGIPDPSKVFASDFQGQRDIYQTKAEQEKEDQARQRFIAGFSPVLPDMPLPKLDPLTFDPEEYEDLAEIEPYKREALAKSWVQRHLRAVTEQYQRIKYEYIYLVSSQYEFKEQIKVDALQHSQVIGLTTTGTTINKELLSKVKPTILIVEEAAEILESQILSCLGQESIQQVVLVGDHKQLRPIVHSYALAKECRLDLSLFERMANNDVPVHNLTNQRRMVPQISQFVRPLYRQLNDDACLIPRKMHCDVSGEIREPGNIPGLGKPVWFWTHDIPETKSEVGLSVVNTAEVKMTIWLVKYFHARGMSLNQITILTPYKGQLREIREAAEAADVHRTDMVCTVDRFQGDENDLMIVSLVRTNKLTEFIKAPDRMCVLLSRARFGMVILGSSQLLDNPEVPHWQRTMDTLSANRWIGNYFPLVCDRHPAEHPPQLKVADLIKGDGAEHKIDGFCNKPCGSHFTECKKRSVHKCKRVCHSGEHTICDYPCEELLACGHRCRQECGECFNNGCKCSATVQVPSEGCGVFEFGNGAWEFVRHKLTKVGCGSTYGTCQREVFKRLPCGHFWKTHCHIADKAPAVCLDCARGKAPEDPSLPDLLAEHPSQAELHARVLPGRLSARRLPQAVKHESAYDDDDADDRTSVVKGEVKEEEPAGAESVDIADLLGDVMFAVKGEEAGDVKAEVKAEDNEGTALPIIHAAASESNAADTRFAASSTAAIKDEDAGSDVGSVVLAHELERETNGAVKPEITDQAEDVKPRNGIVKSEIQDDDGSEAELDPATAEALLNTAAMDLDEAADQEPEEPAPAAKRRRTD